MFKNRVFLKLSALVTLLSVSLLFCFSISSNEKISQNEVGNLSTLKAGFAISVDSKTVCILENISDAELLSEQLLSKAERYYKTGENYSILNTVEIIEGKYAAEDFSTVAEAEKALSVSIVLGSPTVETLNGEKIIISLCETTLTEKLKETEFVTRYEYTYGVSKSYETVISEGKNGVVREIYETKKIDGEIVSETLVLDSVVCEPTDRVVEIGVTPSMQLASSELAYFIKPYDGIVSSPYGYRSFGGGSLHKGTDIVARKGSCYGDTAVAAADGVVVESGYSTTRGNYVIIKHEFGFVTEYMHFKSRLVSKGDIVSAGDPIGLIGSTGRSTGPHLHFEIRLNGKNVNPENYLSFK